MLLGASDRHASATGEVEQAFVAQRSKRAQDGIAVDAEHCGEVARGRQPVAGACLAAGNRPPDLSCDLFVQLGGVGTVELDVQDGASNTSSIRMTPETEPRPADLSSADFASAAQALFEEARRRARRRRRLSTIGFGLVLVAVGIAIVLIANHKRPPSNGGEPAAVAVRPERVLTQPPYLGVSCRQANSIVCDRVGLAVYTLPNARAVRATIAGRRMELTDDPAFVGPHQRGQPRMFVGFLHHAGLRHGPLAVQVENGRNRWTGVHPVHTKLSLTITLADGSRETTTTRVILRSGWG